MSTITAALDAADADPTPSGRSTAGPWDILRAVLRPLASLRLTIVLFLLSLGLVFFGTLAQMNNGIWTIVEQYFWSIWVKVDYQLLVQFFQKFDVLGVIPPHATVSGWFPFIGGKLLGFALLVNLLAAHLVRFKLSWRRAGVIVLHAGLVLLFVGEYITREYSVEQRMEIAEGGTANYAYDIRNCELAVVDGSDPTQDRMTVIPGRMLEAGGRITDDDLPVDVAVDAYHKNAMLDDLKPGESTPATAGIGLKLRVDVRGEVSGVDTQQGADFPAAYVTLYRKGTEEKLGTYLVSTLADRIGMTQPITADGKTYDLSLRFTRHYKPYTLKLIEFRFDRFVGTSTAKNYSSRVVLDDPERGVHEETTISMNDPLRYRGETFYQSGFDERTEKSTVLQVVRNPGWTLPYIACVVVAFGMLVHFGRGISTFIGRQKAQIGAEHIQPHTGLERGLPWVAVGLTGIVFIAAAMPRSTGGAMNLSAAGQLPVVDRGRLKPLDTVARTDLRVISTREEYRDPTGHNQPAIRWFFEMASTPPSSGERPNLGPAAKYEVFRIENDQVRKLLNLPAREGMRYSLDEMKEKFGEFGRAADKAEKKRKDDRDLFDLKVMDLNQQIQVYLGVLFQQKPLVLPARGGADWTSAGATRAKIDEAVSREVFAAFTAKFPDVKDARSLTPEQQDEARRIVQDAQEKAAAQHPAYAAWERILAAYHKGDAAEFNRLVAEYRDTQYPDLSHWDAKRVRLESFLNNFAPFYYCIGLYVLAFLLAVGGWAVMVVRPTLGESFRRAAFGVLVVTFAVHLVALLARMYLMGRPLVFVTNLYSSAVFIGCAGVGICLLIERMFPMGLGNAVAAAIGCGTGIIAHNLAAGGDTLEMMQAVLDTNLWLATHVTTITLGYSATYVAGLIAIAYVLLGVFTPVLDRPRMVGGRPVPLGRVIGMILYGVICGATLLSFVGTVLGGIWADQSWGRFWGWDPKENGAVLIVIWNALILHARWAGLVKDRGMVTLALVGNIITTWSWFGTNQLGVGLHAYGFNNTLAAGCGITWLVHIGLIMLALVPIRYWRSHPNRTSVV